jgi:pyruvate/2-oxoglutarate dehydrogenase complex dihydrolipoamide acyltransferase (E2) component
MDERVATAPSSASATVEVTMPETGSPEMARLSAWLKRPGETVQVEEAICLVAWAGSSAEVASPAAGVLRMVAVAAGDQLTIGGALAVIDVGVPRG